VKDGPRQDPFASLRANTLIWIAVVIWLVWGYLGQTPPGGPYTAGLRGAFVAVLAAIVPLITLIIVAAWIVALRDRRKGEADR
jgi:quinol-cytochrome oxidoreductase complex cytochrome b subunit